MGSLTEPSTAGLNLHPWDAVSWRHDGRSQCTSSYYVVQQTTVHVLHVSCPQTLYSQSLQPEKFSVLVILDKLISICHTNVEQIGQLFWVILLFFLICQVTSLVIFHQLDMFVIQIFYLSDNMFLSLNGQSWLQPEWHQLFTDIKCTVTDC